MVPLSVKYGGTSLKLSPNIVNITNDTWFGKYLGPYQHFYFSKLRASEFNKPIIRVSNNGISGIINSYGQIISVIELNKSKSIGFNINFKDNNKYYKMHYYLNIYFLIILLLLAVPNFRNKWQLINLKIDYLVEQEEEAKKR